jgi:hypothetical protein
MSVTVSGFSQDRTMTSLEALLALLLAMLASGLLHLGRTRCVTMTN